MFNLMKKRVFIAINFPENAKNKLEEVQRKTENSFSYFNGVCPVIWTKKNNLHITLLFLGNIETEELFDVFEKLEAITSKTSPLEINLNSITYSPKDNPRMVWVSGEKSKELKEFQEKIEEELFNRGNKEFNVHVTLGRIRQWQFKRINKEEIPELEQVDLSFKVNSIEVMESELKRGGAVYTTLKSFPLNS